MRPAVHKLQIARRSLQILVLFFVLMIPAAARYNNYLSARELDKALEKWNGTLQGQTLQMIDTIFRHLPNGEEERSGRIVRNRDQALAYAQAFRGGPWSVSIGPISMTDPLAAAESMAASKKSVRVLWIGLLVPLAAVLILGRVFCSWICPMGFLLELTDKIRRPLRWLEIKPADVRVWRGTKYVLLVVGLGLAAVFSMPLLGYVYPPAIVGRELHDLVFGIFDRAEMGQFGWWWGGLTWMSLILIGIAALEVFVTRRWWCRYVCPGGGLYSLLGWLRPVRVRLDTSKCTSCSLCDKVCHLGLHPMRNQMGPECDNCGLCISSCGDNALDYGIQIRARERAPARSRKQRVAAALVVILGFGILASALVSSKAHAHHILGIPHYAYDERYPQVPILTYRVNAGEYEIELTGYPGTPQPGERCFVNVYLRNLEDGSPFDGRVELEVILDRMFRSDPVVYGPIEAELEEAVYKFYPKFDTEAHYTLRIRFEHLEEPWTIDLPMVVGEPGSPWLVLGSVGAALLAFLVIIRALRIKKLRRERQTSHSVIGSGSARGEGAVRAVRGGVSP